MVLHIDCNSFYASCEVAFRPDLIGKPVAVANCNELGGGIILALTKEAKALGLKRGDPVFKVKDLLNRHNVAVFPANLQKYVDISRRLMQVVKQMDLVVNFKQYSVDEFFAELPQTEPDDLRTVTRTIKEHIQRCTGIPVSCGISLTYTLAKVATWYAKRYKNSGGICLLPARSIEKALEQLPVGDIWGIGRHSAEKLVGRGIRTALEFYRRPEYEVRHLLHVNGARTWGELHGTPMVSIDNPFRQQSIVHSRTFGNMIPDIGTLESLIADYAVAAARKLRSQQSVCLTVGVFLCTNPFRGDLEQYDNFAQINLPMATADSMLICHYAHEVLRAIFRPYYQYKRAGVMLANISPDDAIQLDLFAGESGANIRRSRRLMGTVDAITDKYGMSSLKVGSQSLAQPTPDLTNFQPFKNQTTNINDIIVIKS